MLLTLAASAQTLAFPGAEGFGAFAKGGRGGDVYCVTSLDDSGPGSLREGIRTAEGPRTIVFGVSGLIRLASNLTIDKNNITIAGQTAPGDGICLCDRTLTIEGDDTIVRFIRSRLGDDAGVEADAVSINRGNFIGNCAKLGPDSTPGHLYNASSKYFRAFYEGNLYDGRMPDDPWSLVSLPGNWTEAERDAYKMSKPFPAGPIATDSAREAWDKVLKHAGASLPKRDAVDTRVVNDVIRGTGAIIDHEEAVGGWPEYKTYSILSDTDGDGMPDVWEREMHLDPNDANDRNGNGLDGVYTNLEIYLNRLAAKAG